MASSFPRGRQEKPTQSFFTYGSKSRRNASQRIYLSASSVTSSRRHISFRRLRLCRTNLYLLRWYPTYTNLAQIWSRKTRQKNRYRSLNCNDSRRYWHRPTSIIILSRSYVIMINIGCFGGVVTQRSAKPRTPVQFR